MRIAVFTYWYPTKQETTWGVFIKNQAIALARKEDVTLFVIRRAFLPRVLTEQHGNLKVIVTEYPILPHTKEKRLLGTAKQFLKAFYKHHEKESFNVIHAHDIYASYFASDAARRTNLPYFCTVHTSSILLGELPEWKHKMLKPVFQQATMCLPVGQGLKEAMKQQFELQNIKVVPNFVDTNRFCYLPTNSKTVNYIFVGVLYEKKGVEEIVKAFAEAVKKNTNIRLSMYGAGPLREELSQLIERLEMKQYIFLKGKYPNERVQEIYQQHQVYISFSRVETFGLTILEAMACGLLIIYPKSGGPEHFVPQFAGVQLPERTADRLTKAILDVAKTINDYEPKKISGFVEEHFSEDKVVQKLLDLYHDT